MDRDYSIAWAAGLFEGEGCFYLKRLKDGEKVRLLAEASMVTTDKDVLEKFCSVVGVGKVYTHRKGPSGISKKPTWQWRIGGTKALAMGEEFRPYLGQRRTAKLNELILKNGSVE